ncbi:MAG: NAD(P)-dependent oxidoreductase [Candidatus Rokubacteria bacterium]|nr:NAD(P)-dependent oxidoreductase [Candidatus Rokubacteria bacterium]
MKVLVSGATGFVMANLVRHFLEAGDTVIAADLNPPDAALARFWARLAGRADFHRLDVADAAAARAMIAEVQPEATVHGAAITTIPPEMERARFVETVRVNVDGTLHVLDALLAARARGRVVVVSSGSVYGPRADRAPITEDDPKAPQGVYGMTKWMAESLARRFADVHGLDLGVVRLASPFGPLERDRGARPLLSPIHAWATAALRGEPLRIGGDPTAPRDAIHAADVASAIAAILKSPRLAHDAYNVGWGFGTSAEQAIAALRRLVPGLKVDVDPAAPAPWTTRGPLRIDRLRQDLGWTPRHDLDSGLAAYLDWLRHES